MLLPTSQKEHVHCVDTQWNEGNISSTPDPTPVHSAPLCFDPKDCTADRTAEGLFGLERICSALKKKE